MEESYGVWIVFADGIKQDETGVVITKRRLLLPAGAEPPDDLLQVSRQTMNLAEDLRRNPSFKGEVREEIGPPIRFEDLPRSFERTDTDGLPEHE